MTDWVRSLPRATAAESKQAQPETWNPETPPPHTRSHIYTHHNSCYIKAVITTASWLSISVYLWCITHFNAILKQRLSCHCSAFGWGKKTKPTNGCNIQYVVLWEQRINKCSATSRVQWLRVINSMTPRPHFSLAHGYTLQQGTGGVTVGKGEGLERFLKWPVKPSWLQESPYIILCLCNHV